ncbi:hypothetical protein IFM89_022097 [Coptis chinensis]|uniref:MIF4G domain-containing protein n=1 Tax=Coptis chinensis TaxID=261450 RepID=A0A835HEW5_9MAGN|nr:hypothetical protein IFM89_022097 [Coptis chinensis]
MKGCLYTKGSVGTSSFHHPYTSMKLNLSLNKMQSAAHRIGPSLVPMEILLGLKISSLLKEEGMKRVTLKRNAASPSSPSSTNHGLLRTLVENAYYLCKPPERSARVSKTRPLLHQYIRKCFSGLDKSSIEHILRQFRKLPWNECEPYLIKCFMKVHKGKYSQVHVIASLTAGLSRYHDEFAVAVVDKVLEEIRLGLELNDYSFQQRRIAHMCFLGELYNYEHIDSSVIFETLYLILAFGHGTSEV